MNHLAIDTATEVLSIALEVGSQPSRRFVRVRDAGLRHTTSLMPLVDSLLGEAGLTPRELELVSCTRGPGSFTGLRIGMATAKGIASALDARRPPIVSVPTLDVMAAALVAPGALVLPVIDGKKGRFYGAAYANGSRLTPDLDLAPSELADAALRARRDSDDGRGVDAPLSLVVTGPHATAFCERIDAERAGGIAGYSLSVDPRARAGWASVLLDLAEKRRERFGLDLPGEGPEYVRGSDAEIARRNAARYG
ncbi:MAG: tRNA (adenosine(37)-N6)-threonylcarbamoyltransferase complex dimerization subunit type 1 TsaB [Spirochaetota bacterium]